MKYEELVQFDTQLTADVVEWQPLCQEERTEHPLSRVLACGTYQLNKEERTRSGRLHLLKFDLEARSLGQLATHDFATSGILDLKWIDHRHIVTVDSVNRVNVLAFDQQQGKLESVQETDLNETPGQPSVGLTIDHAPGSTDHHSLLVSDDKGYLTSIRVSSERPCQVQSRFKAHELETWSVLIDRSDPQIVYSGADDCLMKVWDLRSNEQPIGKCAIFEGGVCSILQPQRTAVDACGNSSQQIVAGFSEHDILASSYDERIYRLDKRNMKRSVSQSPKLNGGVWKMKMHASKDLLLCACMHTGVHVVAMGDLESRLYYQGHELNSLAYGCDWMPKTDQTSSSDIVASCSFYDHNLRIWKCSYD